MSIKLADISSVNSSASCTERFINLTFGSMVNEALCLEVQSVRLEELPSTNIVYRIGYWVVMKFEEFLIKIGCVKNPKKGDVSEIGIYSKDPIFNDYEVHERILKYFGFKRPSSKKKETKIRFIEATSSGYRLSKYLPFKKQPKTCEDTVSCYYNDDFKPIHLKMLSDLKTPNKGLYLLHGVPGSGKTSYIKALSSLIKNRDFIFLPSTYASALSEPSFLTFLSSECKNSILILEDAEEILKDRAVNRTSAVPNILNLTDGLLGDMLNISLICTFNADDKSIDQALLRKGRAKVNYKFDKLSLEKCQNINPSITQPCSLADALLFEEDSLKIERPTIGFGRN